MINCLEKLPFWLFCLVVFSLPFVNFPNLRDLGVSIQLTDFLLVLAGLVWVTSLVLKRSRLRYSGFYLPLSLYFASLCVSTIFSENPQTSLIKLLGNLDLLGLGVLAFNLVDDEKRFRQIGIAWLSGTFLVCLVSFASLVLFYFQRDSPVLLETLSHYGSLPAANYPRIQSTFFNPNMLCNYLNISAMFLFLAFRLNWFKAWFLLIFAGLITLAIIFTVSPGIGGILLAGGIWFWSRSRSVESFRSPGRTRSLVSKLALAAGIAGAVLFFLSVLPSPTNFPAKVEPSPRVLTWTSALESLQRHPFVGRGIGLDAGHVVYQSPNGEQVLGDAHQLWLNVAAQQGIVGAFAIIFLTVWFFRRCLPIDAVETPVKTALGLAFIGAFCFQGLVGSYEDARHLWVLLGLLASVDQINPKI